MKTIYSFAIAIACLIASFNADAQCTFNTTAPSGAPGATNFFTSGAEGFTGNITASGGALHTTNSNGNVTITTPIYYITWSQSQIIVRFNLDRNASNTITAYNITATTNSNPSIALCSASGLNISPNSNPVYYLTIPVSGLLNGATNFKLNIQFTQTGAFDIDNFGTTASTANGTLPVHFTAFDAKPSAGAVHLNWNVESEENLKGYNVERSLDGKNFAQIGSVAAAGQNSYSFDDTKSASGVSYYRIKSVDIDGKYMYSTTVSVKGTSASTILRAIPSLVQSDVIIQHETAAKGSQINVASEDGRIIKSVVPAIGTQQTVVNLSTANRGLYIIRFVNASGEMETVKVVKQ